MPSDKKEGELEQWKPIGPAFLNYAKQLFLLHVIYVTFFRSYLERVFFRNSQKLTQNLAGNVLVILCLSGQWLARADAFPAFVPGICCTCRQNSSLCILISKSFCEVQYGCMYHSGICAAFALLHSNFEGVIITPLVGLI